MSKESSERDALIAELRALGASTHVCGGDGSALSLESLREIVAFGKRLAAKSIPATVDIKQHSFACNIYCGGLCDCF